MAHEYDRSSKWLIQHHGDSLLRLGGVRDVEWWRALQAEVVQPRRLPDGLLEARLKGETESSLFLLEIATYPERRLGDQLAEDLMMVWMATRKLPDAITIVLRPRGRARPAASRRIKSPHGLSGLRMNWHVVPLWTVPAEALLGLGDVGVVPWVPLAQYEGPPEPLMVECRRRIDENSIPSERENLLTVTQVLASLRYNEPALLEILGGPRVMIESPVIQELLADRRQQDLIQFLRSRFDDLPPEIVDKIRCTSDGNQLDRLIEAAARCPDLATFADRLAAIG